jgi:hypothetical protein
MVTDDMNTRMIRSSVIVKTIFVVGVLCSNSCTDRGIDPPPLKDPRTYTWTVDTIAYADAFQTNMNDIAGTSASNVFTVGFNSTASAGTMYRFDGNTWRTTGFHMREGGPISGAVDFSSLMIFSFNNIWFVGSRFRLNPSPPPNFIDSSFVLHYDGSTWTEHNASGARGLLSIHGIAPNDIWASGVYGTLLHYNGSQWQRDSIPLSFSENWFYGFRDIVVADPENVYALVNAEKLGDYPRYYFLHRTGAQWTIVDSVVARSDSDLRWGTIDLWASPKGTLYSVGGVGVYRWTGMHWVRIYDSPEPLSRIWGFTDESFFVGGYRTLLHCNGNDFFQYPEFVQSATNNVGIWGDGNELFVIGRDGQRSYVYRGR